MELCKTAKRIHKSTSKSEAKFRTMEAKENGEFEPLEQGQLSQCDENGADKQVPSSTGGNLFGVGDSATTEANTDSALWSAEQPSAEQPSAQQEQPRRPSFQQWQLRASEILRASLTAAGLDENGDPVDLLAQTQANFVVWCAVAENSIELIKTWRRRVAMQLTWLFQAPKGIMFFFILYIVYKYGHIRLGKAGERPSFSTLSMLFMIFAAGTGPAIFVYCVQEPLSHQTGSGYAQAGYHSQDEIHGFSINMTVTNWGVTCWLQYTVVAICLSLAGYRFNLPMTLRSCFYPILGAYTWGWMGDFIDAMSIVVTLAGVCATLAEPAFQIVEGLVYIGWVDANNQADNITSIQISTIWFLTLISAVTVICGLRGSIQFICWLAVILGSFLLFLVFVMDDSTYLLNLIVQEVGTYLQNSLFELNLWTDAFAQLREGSGRSVDGKSSDQTWANDWIVFYQAWAVTWSAVFGVFVAYLARGRRIWELVVYCFATPLASCLVWFCIWGGIGLRQSRQAIEMEALGLEHFNNSAHFASDTNPFCYEVPQTDIVVDGEVVFTNHLPGVTPVCRFDAAHGATAVFNVLYSFSFPESFDNGLGKFLTVLFLLCCPVFYLAAADAGSLMVDRIASNGRKTNHWARRMFWGATIGAITTVLIVSSGVDALYAIQATAIISAPPLVIMFCFMLQSILRFCKAADARSDDDEDTDYQFSDQPRFSMPLYGGVFNALEYLSTLGNVHQARVALNMHRPTRAQAFEFCKGLVVPFVSLSQVLSVSYPHNSVLNLCLVGAYTVCFGTWVALFFLSLESPGLKAFAWASFVAAGAMMASARSGFRARHNIHSTVFADIVASTFLWPQVLTQMRLHQGTQSGA